MTTQISLKKLLKNNTNSNYRTNASKKYGWHNKYGGFTLYNIKSDKIESNFCTLLPCTRKECNACEKEINEFKSCQYCLTVYCSQECNKLDWHEHKKFCKSREAYVSQLNKWQMTLPEDIYDNMDKYDKLHNEWLHSEKMQKVLKWIGKTPEDFLIN